MYLFPSQETIQILIFSPTSIGCDTHQRHDSVCFVSGLKPVIILCTVYDSVFIDMHMYLSSPTCVLSDLTSEMPACPEVHVHVPFPAWN